MSAIIPTDRPITYQLQYRKCGATHPCAPCLEGRGHGPYWYAYWKEGTRLRQRYIPERANVDEIFPYSSIGLLNSRATLTKLPLEQHTPLLTLTKWANSLSHVVLHTIFLTPEYLLLLPVLEETTKTLLFLHFCGNASLQCAPRSLKHYNGTRKVDRLMR
jgi:hypothetical protein